MLYARLREDCILIEGGSRSALYDLSGGKVYSLNRSAHKVVTAFQRGVLKKRHLGFVDTLLDLDLVEISDTPFSARGPSKEEAPDATLQFIWLEVTSTCNLSCVHCYGDCLSSQEPDRMDREAWKSIIFQAKDLGCSQIQFIGGEPLLRRDLFRLTEIALAQEYSFVEIFSNLTLLKKSNISFLKDSGIHIATTLYSCNPHTHDLITGVTKSHARTVNAITRLKDNGVPVRVAVIAMRHNQEELSETVDYLQSMGVDYKMPDPVRPTGRGCSKEIQPLNLPPEFSGQMTEANFWTDRNSFYFNTQYNNCWAGKTAVTASGEVIPCIFARDLVVGNAREEGLGDILHNNTVKELWNLTKDHVEVCQDCEYRYACHDCRPLASAYTGNLHAKSPRCLYNPYRGQWKEK